MARPASRRPRLPLAHMRQTCITSGARVAAGVSTWLSPTRGRQACITGGARAGAGGEQVHVPVPRLAVQQPGQGRARAGAAGAVPRPARPAGNWLDRRTLHRLTRLWRCACANARCACLRKPFRASPHQVMVMRKCKRACRVRPRRAWPRAWPRGLTGPVWPRSRWRWRTPT